MSLEERGKKLEEAGEKMNKVGTGLMKFGCGFSLLVFFVIPILFIIFLFFF